MKNQNSNGISVHSYPKLNSEIDFADNQSDFESNYINNINTPKNENGIDLTSHRSAFSIDLLSDIACSRGDGKSSNRSVSKFIGNFSNGNRSG